MEISMVMMNRKIQQEFLKPEKMHLILPIQNHIING